MVVAVRTRNRVHAFSPRGSCPQPPAQAVVRAPAPARIVNNSAWTPAGDAVACLLPVSARNNRILHIDGDSFFASCEIALDPKLEGRPVWVGGGRRGDGIVIAANRQAKKYGIKTGTGGSD